MQYFRLQSHYRVSKKVMSSSLGLVDFAIGLVNSVLNLPWISIYIIITRQIENSKLNYVDQKEKYEVCSLCLY